VILKNGFFGVGNGHETHLFWAPKIAFFRVADRPWPEVIFWGSLLSSSRWPSRSRRRRRASSAAPPRRWRSARRASRQVGMHESRDPSCPLRRGRAPLNSRGHGIMWYFLVERQRWADQTHLQGGRKSRDGRVTGARLASGEAVSAGSTVRAFSGVGEGWNRRFGGQLCQKGKVLAFCKKEAGKSSDLSKNAFFGGWRPIWPRNAPKNRTQKWPISPSGPSVTRGHFFFYYLATLIIALRSQHHCRVSRGPTAYSCDRRLPQEGCGRSMRGGGIAPL